jgi:hypothetical protein
VSPVRVIIGNVIPDKTMQMGFVEHDYMIKEFAAAISDPSFGNSILPRA